MIKKCIVCEREFECFNKPNVPSSRRIGAITRRQHKAITCGNKKCLRVYFRVYRRFCNNRGKK